MATANKSQSGGTGTAGSRVAGKPKAATPHSAPTPSPTPPAAGDLSAAHEVAEKTADKTEVGAEHTRRDFWLFTATPSWLISLVIHMITVFMLAVVTVPQPERVRTELTVASPDPVPEEADQFELKEIVPVTEMQLEKSSLGPTDELATQSLEVETPDMSFTTDLDAAPIAIELSEFGERTAPRNVLTKMIGSATGTGLAGRGSAMRAEMVKEAGGTQGSEAAVASALRWLAYHQLPDGGWNFDHTIGPGQRYTPNPGDLRQARIGATAMALLPFLGAGQTHVEGEYKEVVARGLYFLMQMQKSNGSLHEDGGAMYSHGLASIVLSEAYAMTQDPKIAPAAQGALNFIVFAQDPVSGGWRYEPRNGGDTSVVGWQLMALKSGNMGYLQIPGITIAGAGRFLDSVQTESGAKYGYASPGAGQATTAVGLLCRMFMGWKHDNPALMRGVEYLGNAGPSESDMYYNYYATQVLRHYGGEKWTAWNDKMREFLVKTQSSGEPARGGGSWFIPGDHGAEKGGRLYCTSMATMVLEVYYRHLPIYGKAVADDEFPL